MELRAPDPTLTQHATNDPDVVLSFDGDAPPIAHVLTDEGDVAPCGTPDLDHWCDTGYARWFAVPCRECFPDAPPPGRVRMSLGEGDWLDRSDRHLAWQVG